MQNPPPDQQGYGNQYGAPPPPPPMTNAPGGNDPKGKTQLGLDANLGAALGYPIGILAIILFIMEKENRFARFHALQSLLYHVAAVIVLIALMVVGAIIGFILAMVHLGILGLLFWLLYLIAFVAYFGGLILAAIKAYNGQWFKLPLIGGITEKILNK
jgi:uncharacterized membrane protein